MDNKKFKMTDETITAENGRTLHRIVALKDFGNVHNGDKGGFIERESNLSQEGNCWVYGDAKVFEYSNVEDNAIVRGQHAEVFGHTKVRGNAIVEGNAVIAGRLVDIRDNAKIAGRVLISGWASISGSTIIKGFDNKQNKTIGERKTKNDIAISNGIVIMNSSICDSCIFDNVTIKDDSSIKNSYVSGDVVIDNHTRIRNADLHGDFVVGANAYIQGENYYVGNGEIIVYYVRNETDGNLVLAISVGDKVFHSISEFKTEIKKPTISPEWRKYYKGFLKTATRYIKMHS